LGVVIQTLPVGAGLLRRVDPETELSLAMTILLLATRFHRCRAYYTKLCIKVKLTVSLPLPRINSI
jgi:hypothetical protein